MIEAEVEEFWRNMQCTRYSVIDQLKKMSAQIFLMSLLMSSDSHRNALVKVLNEAYVPAETTSEHFKTMEAQILEAHKITFHGDELPPEGLSHNKALHLIVKCRDKLIFRVFIDNGSALNIFPFTTLKALGIDIEKVREIHVNVRAFDGAQRSAIGEIDLALQIGTVEFIIEFQVLDISSIYSLLLGSSWIHMAGAVLSTLHQNVKFVWNHQKVVIHGEASNPIYPGNSIPIIDNVERLDGAIFHIEEIMTATRGKERDKVAKCVRDGGIKNVGEWFRAWSRTWSKVSWNSRANSVTRAEQHIWPRPILPLSQSFPKTVTIHELDEDAEYDLVEGIRNLFIADYNVILKDCTEMPTIWDVAPGDVLNNWTCTPSSVCRESCKQINKNVDTVNVICNETSEQNSKQDLEEYEEDVPPAELTKELEQFENKSKPNFDKTKLINLGNSEFIKETRISVHLTPSEYEKYVDLLRRHVDVFAWSYDDMPGLSTNIVSHKLPTDPSCPLVKQKTRKFKTDLSLKIKEEVFKTFKANVIRVTKYPTWLANIVPVPKKDGKIRICVDYRDLNKASPKDDFPLPNIHILIDNCAKHELKSFVDCFAGYHQILMDEDDVEKTSFIIPWGCIVIG
ncbi:uncharacterized protein [Nicotiana sylvestris]|uniref:uncharacterized protein n=1 Tax=Nicotiana sylvestris TaxID=4096 RepID=UPI00388C9200